MFKGFKNSLLMSMLIFGSNLCLEAEPTKLYDGQYVWISDKGPGKNVGLFRRLGRLVIWPVKTAGTGVKNAFVGACFTFGGIVVVYKLGVLGDKYSEKLKDLERRLCDGSLVKDGLTKTKGVVGETASKVREAWDKR